MPLQGDVRGLRTLLDDLAAQRLERDRFELVLVDDGCTTDVAAIVGPRSGDLGLQVVAQRRSGLVAARVHGLYRARGDAVLFLEATDRLPVRFLERHAEFHAARRDPPAALAGPFPLAPDVGSDPAQAELWRADPIRSRHAADGPSGPADLRSWWAARWSFKRDLAVGLAGSIQLGGESDGPFLFAHRLWREGLELAFDPEAGCADGRAQTLDGRRQELQGLGRAAAWVAAADSSWKPRRWLGLPRGWRLTSALTPLHRACAGAVGQRPEPTVAEEAPVGSEGGWREVMRIAAVRCSLRGAMIEGLRDHGR